MSDAYIIYGLKMRNYIVAMFRGPKPNVETRGHCQQAYLWEWHANSIQIGSFLIDYPEKKITKLISINSHERMKITAINNISLFALKLQIVMSIPFLL